MKQKIFLLGLVPGMLFLSALKPGAEKKNLVLRDSAKLEVSAVKLYDGLKNPWGMVWLADGRLLVTERSGEILIFKDDKYTGQKLTGVPAVVAKGQGGLMDIKLHPDYKGPNSLDWK